MKDNIKIKDIPLNDLHKKLGGKMVPYAGYNMPVRYSSDKEEHLKVRESVGVFDVSHMGEFMLLGSHALDLIQWVTSNDASKLVDGQAQYSYLPNHNGGIVDDLLVYRMNEETYMLVVNASNIEKDWDWIKKQNKWGVEMKNISDDTVLLAVQGPKSMETLQKLTPVNLSEIKFYRFVQDELAGKNMIISATGYTGSGGFELYIKKKDAKEVWNEIFNAGDTFGIKPIGLGARDTLRLEKGFCLYGNDITDDTSPLEAGLGWVTKFTKNFLNSNNLKILKEGGLTQKLVGFKMLDKGIPRPGYELLNVEGKNIGTITSGTISPSLNVGIGMGYVSKEYGMIDTELYVPIRNKSLKAKVVKIPFI